ncbi:unnamed protein product [Rotaria sordida]|uniref:Phosphatidylinositol N-acetylglucosaminyltransferase subunit P n=1 Tax=Rotaria sordida TaxID=392033 RepID=A0A813YT25_9BILA|nr:unnamed protein product [Rotaria sordida]CAF0888729.1 unnamed protein product [Rotaria sordida]CAF1063194.1 unnamed protein product [Rotaria sordida]CAF1235271.1 unnamed protein product [Rotaria sordida]CAF3667160.1 unnamed protein product [Rotaria sordida]
MSTTPSPLPSPERAIIGFFLYVASIFTFIIYLLWAYLPNNWFENIGITYYPHKYWSIAIAILVVTLLIGIVLVNCLVNSLSVPSLDSMKLIQDRHTRKKMNVKNLNTDAIPPVCDLDLSFVNQVLYSSDIK